MRSGDRIGPYTILSALGAGGMGVVYRARDERLDRDVAIKTLPRGALGSEPARRRFRQEALALAKVSHPGIAAVYDVVQEGEAAFLVMECVAGQTLAERLAPGPLPVRDALALGAEIAAALAEAHECGVVHRDLKPGNVMVTSRGRAKVLDFGLAKLFATDATPSRLSQAETDTRGIVGTPSYMSPEQAEGRTVDARSDLWSLGVVLYQALSGEVPFSGDGVLSVLRAVTDTSPRPLREIRPDTPEDVSRIVAHALEKDVSKRYQSATEMGRDLSAALTRITVPASSRVSEPRYLTRRAMAAAAGALVLLAAAGGWLYHRSERRRWAREEALPEIARLKDADKPLAAFLLAGQVAPLLNGDPDSVHATEVDTQLVSVGSSPAGATVEIQDYLSPDGSWLRLGTTPLDKVRIPKGYFRWRLSKAGLAAYTAAPLTEDEMRFPLDAQSSAPAGMSGVERGSWFEMIDFIGWVGPYELPAYYIDRLEVTNRQYQEFVDAGGYRKQEYWTRPFEREGRTLSFDAASALLRDRTGRPGPSTWQGGHYAEGQGELPVSGVSWYEAAAYAAWAGKSLPVLAQWFRAAPAETARFTVPSSNFSGAALARPGAYQGLGPFGTYDMAGNVREWIENSASGDRRFILGGAWSSQSYLYVTPEALPPFDRSPINGFRCVKNAGLLPAAAVGQIKIEDRDFSRVRPASDAVFRAYAPLYAHDRTPLDARVETTREAADWREETITLAAAYGNQRLPLHLLLPRRVKPPYQTVVFFPSARVLFIRDSRDLGDTRFFDYVVQSGRAIAYPIYQGTYDRRAESALPGTAHTTQLVTERYKDFARSLDYLETRPDVDQTRLAYLGVSMGSAEGVIYATLAQRRLRTAIFLDGGFFLYEPPAGVDQADFAPRLRIPCLMVNGRYDFTFSLSKAQTPLFDMIGTPPADKRHVVLETPHDVAMRRGELVSEVLGWLDRYLGRVD